MKNKFILFFIVFGAFGFSNNARAENLDYSGGAGLSDDSADPLFMLKMGDVLSQSSGGFNNSVMRVSQKLSYGVNNRLSLGLDIDYVQDFNGDSDGFSNVGFDGVYRLSDASDKIISQALFGVKLGGGGRVPDFKHTVYSGGLRMGRVFSWVTVSGAIKTSWIFDDVMGRADIDFVPDAYFRITDTWMTGIGADFKKSTNPIFDQEWLNFKLVKKYGHTQYIGHIDYEFESDEYRVGAKVNILF